MPRKNIGFSIRVPDEDIYDGNHDGIVESWKSDPYKVVLIHELQEIVQKALATFTKQEREAIRLRFGFDCSPHTFRAIGDILGVGIERARQVEAKAIRKLRNPNYARKLRIFTDEANLCLCAFSDRAEEMGTPPRMSAEEKYKKINLLQLQNELTRLEGYKKVCEQDLSDSIIIKGMRLNRVKELQGILSATPNHRAVIDELEGELNRYNIKVEYASKRIEKAKERLDHYLNPEIKRVTAEMNRIENLDSKGLKRWIKNEKGLTAKRKRVGVEMEKLTWEVEIHHWKSSS